MEDRLTSLGACIDDQPIPLRDALLLCHPPSHDEELAEQLHIIISDVVDIFYVLVGDNQHVSWRLRIPVVECSDLVVVVDNAG